MGRVRQFWTPAVLVLFSIVSASSSSAPQYRMTAPIAPGDGGHQYVMHFAKAELPASAVNVSSILPYRDNFYVRNSLSRYGILSTMPLKYNGDGSLDVYLQKDSPGADKESNWLPIPASGSYNLAVRVYQPKQSFIDGTYNCLR